jgi:hypothetical protein
VDIVCPQWNEREFFSLAREKINGYMSFEKLLTDLGERIEKIMQMKCVSKEEMMSMLDCDERTLRRILKGESPTTLNRINEIAEALDVEVSMIIQVAVKRISFKKKIASFN